MWLLPGICALAPVAVPQQLALTLYLSGDVLEIGKGGWSSCGWEGLTQPCLRPGARSCLPGAENHLPKQSVWTDWAPKEEKGRGQRAGSLADKAEPGGVRGMKGSQKEQGLWDTHSLILQSSKLWCPSCLPPGLEIWQSNPLYAPGSPGPGMGWGRGVCHWRHLLAFVSRYRSERDQGSEQDLRCGNRTLFGDPQRSHTLSPDRTRIFETKNSIIAFSSFMVQL